MLYCKSHQYPCPYSFEYIKLLQTQILAGDNYHFESFLHMDVATLFVTLIARIHNNENIMHNMHFQFDGNVGLFRIAANSTIDHKC